MLLEDCGVGLKHIRYGEKGAEVQVREGLTLGLPAMGEASLLLWFRALRVKGLS